LRFVLVVFVFVGCWAPAVRYAPEAVMSTPPAKGPHHQSTPKPAPTAKKGQPDTLFFFQQQKRLVIYTACVTLEVADVDEVRKAVLRLAKDAGGYLKQETNTQITVRVPAEKFEQTLEKICKLGRVVERDINAQDVTEEYQDLQLRLNALRKHLQRLEQVLQKAKDLGEIARIMAQIKEVVVEIERLEGRLCSLKVAVAYSTITVRLTKPESRVAEQAAVTPLPFEWVNLLCVSRLFPD